MKNMEALRHKPVAFFKMDDTAPFQDHSGYNRSGTLTGTENHGLSLAADAVYSQKLSRAAYATFASPIYQAGKESQPFSMAATVYPVATTEGITAQPYRENRALNPVGVSTGPNYEYLQRWGWSVSWTTNGSGSPIGNTNWATLTSPASIQTAVTSRGLDMYTNHDTTPGTGTSAKVQPVTAGESLTISVWVRPSVDTTFKITARVHDGNGAWLDAVAYSGPNTSIPANMWSRVSLSFVSQYTGFLAVGVRTYTSQDWPANSTIDVTGILIENSPTLNAYFDGNIPGHEWVGLPNQSGSRTMKGVHRVNLAGAITNGNTGIDENGIGALDTTNGIVNRGYSWNGSTWLKFTWNGTGNRILRQMARRIDLLSGEHYTVTATFGNDGATPVEILMDWTDSFQKTVTVPAGGTIIVSTGGIRTGGYNNVYRFADFEPTVASSFLIKDIIIEHTSTSKPFFNGNTAGATWSGTVGASPSLMLVSNSEQKILSGQSYDGLSIDGTTVSFSTAYTNTGEAKCSHNLEVRRKADVVGVHSQTKNSLYVDGVLVDEVDITPEQQADTYAITGTNLFSGQTDSSQVIMVNNVALYAHALQPENVKAIYQANNRRALGDVPNMFSGDNLFVSSTVRPPQISMLWNEDIDWNTGQHEQTTVDNGQLVAQMSNGLTIASTWIDSVDLYSGETPLAINSMNMYWYGEGETVEVSLDGDTWTPATKGKNLPIIPVGFDPTGKELYVRVSFDSGLDYAYIDYLQVRGYTSNTVTWENRLFTYTAPLVVGDEYDPLLMRDDWGVNIETGGSLTIGPDTYSDSPSSVNTVEVWYKKNTGALTHNLTVTDTYINGVLNGTSDQGEWAVAHFTVPAGVTGDIVLSGDVQIGRVAVYDYVLSATDVSNVIANYTGTRKTSTAGDATVSLSEPATPAVIYAHDWEIVAS